MKRYGNLIHDIADPETIKLALHQAAIGKRHRKSVSRRLNHEEETIQQIQHLLLSGEFKPAKVKTWTGHERGKDRQITTTPFFPDQLIHWSIMLVLQPIFLKSMYEYNLATVPSRGMAQGRKVIPKWLQNDPKRTKYCLKMDIHHFYASINTDILKLKLQHRFKDPQVLRLLGAIIDSYSPGLPLGLYTSQWLANFYLEDFDHQVKNDWQIPHYVRYMDDLVMLSGNKKKLHRARDQMDAYLKAEGLVIKPNWQLFRVGSRPIDFLGYRFYRDHVTLRRKLALRIRRKAAKVGRKDRLTYHDAASMISYWGWLKHTNSYGFYHKYVKPNLSIKKAKGIVKHENNLRNRTG